jgi:hypothetical protein
MFFLAVVVSLGLCVVWGVGEGEGGQTRAKPGGCTLVWSYNNPSFLIPRHIAISSQNDLNKLVETLAQLYTCETSVVGFWLFSTTIFSRLLFQLATATVS